MCTEMEITCSVPVCKSEESTDQGCSVVGGVTPNVLCGIKEYINIMSGKDFLCNLYIYYVNHRIHDTVDPLTHTLVLMATSPLQLVFCETGVLPFRTTELPVYPFADMTPTQRAQFSEILANMPNDKIRECNHDGGKITVSIPLRGIFYADKLNLLGAFVSAGIYRSKLYTEDNNVRIQFCHIIFQRFLSSVSLSIDVVKTIKTLIDESHTLVT